MNLSSLDHIMNLRTNSVPGTIQRGVEDAAERLDREMGMSAGRLGEERGAEVRPVHEYWVVTISGNAVVIGRPLILVGAVLGDSSGLTSDTAVSVCCEADGGEIGCHSHVT